LGPEVEGKLEKTVGGKALLVGKNRKKKEAEIKGEKVSYRRGTTLRERQR